MPSSKDIWVFGYGSLMWRPEFDFVERQPALLGGYHRALCVYSIHYRGVPGKPGLVVGLDRGGSCRGRAMRVAAAKASQVMDYLRKRELVNGVYREAWLPVRIGERRVTAVTYVVNRDHEHYVGTLSIERTAAVVARAAGPAGTALDYLQNTIVHLDDLGIKEGRLHRILARAERLAKRET
jgi:cation transport protein ChaC